jgi:TRAP-type C4-dicarboxylate transport system permease small subunit
VRAVGAVVAGVGAVLAVFGSLIGLIGLEVALTAWNDEMGLLPWGLSRILGISVYLDIPADTAWWAAIAGVVLAVLGVLLVLIGSRRGGRDRPAPASETARDPAVV